MAEDHAGDERPQADVSSKPRSVDRDEASLPDVLKSAFGFATDAQLATWLDLKEGDVHAIRSGHTVLGAAERITILGRLGILNARQVTDSILPRILTVQVVRWAQQSAGGAKPITTPGSVVGNDFAALLDACQIAFHLDTDLDLAAFLGLRPSDIARIRLRKSRMGIHPRLRILSRLAPQGAFVDIEQAIATKNLLTQIQARHEFSAHPARYRRHDESRLLDVLRSTFGLANDAQLAEWLCISRSILSRVRGGYLNLAPRYRLKALDRLGVLRSRQLLPSLQTLSIANDVIRWRRTKDRNATFSIVSAHDANDDVYLLDVCREAFELATDVALAHFLDARANTIAMIRLGEWKLGAQARLRLLDEVLPEEGYGDVERALVSTDHMLAILDQHRHHVADSGPDRPVHKTERVAARLEEPAAEQNAAQAFRQALATKKGKIIPGVRVLRRART